MDDITKKIQEEMKSIMKDKTECMLDSYLELLGKVDKGITKTLRDTGASAEGSEILKRADMFWHTALQKIEKEQAESKRKIEDDKNKAMQAQMQPQMSPMNMPMNHNKMPPVYPTESPCAKKARESAEKVATLEAQIIKDKEGKK